MSYQVLARKWRPRRFEDLVGQGHVVRALVNGLDNDRLHHAFLFTGTRGVGKTTIARILAKSLNCEKGVSSKPCGECSACREVDEGRFVDLIEVDAASRTKVDETRELLDNVQYAPSRGRYKVYLIDEVHMLSSHSFNALLKTLEEPPPHVKFLLATTDPQKLPVTVLSRCLQFTLFRMTPEQVEEQLKKILDAEKIEYELPALTLLARGADGSMRDGLSLLDQAIAFGGGTVREAEVREMLGTIDQNSIWQLLEALAGSNASQLIATVSDAAQRSLDYASMLDELLNALHRIALVQADGALIDTLYAEERAQIARFAGILSREDVQLYYQIGLIGRRDLPLAPDGRGGLEMVLLRMLAFRPADAASATGAAPAGGGATRASQTPATAATAAPASAASPATSAVAPPPVENTSPVATPAPVAAPPVAQATTRTALTSESWSNVVEQLKLTGLNHQLANNAALESFDGSTAQLVLDQAYAQLHTRERESALAAALERYYGKPVKLSLRIGKPNAETPALEKQRIADERQVAAVQAIENDPNVAAFEEQLGARVRTETIRPKTQ
jgi:DNA polymerase-3 subunit gamma/tau